MPEMWEREDMNSKMDKMLSKWCDIERAVMEKREPVPRGENVGGRGGIGDPTANEAIRNAEKIPFVFASGVRVNQPEEWLDVFSSSYAKLDGVSREIMKRRYRFHESYLRTSTALRISDRTYYSMLDEIKSYVTIIAIQHSLIRVI